MKRKHTLAPQGMVPWWVPHLGLYCLAALIVWFGVTPGGLGIMLSLGGMGQALWAPIPFLIGVIACAFAITIAGMVWRLGAVLRAYFSKRGKQ